MAPGLAMAQRFLTFVLLTACVLIAPGVMASAPPRTTVFNDLIVNEKIDGDVVAFEAGVHLGPMADVAGDVVVIGGNLRCDPGARVGRHVLVVFGGLRIDPEATVEGRTLAFTSLSRVLLRAEDDTPLQVSLGVRLVTSGGWLLVTTALAFGLSTRLRYGVWVLPHLGFRVLVLGLAAGITFFAAAVAVLGLGPTLGVPMAAALTLVFVALRAVGLTVIGGYLGGWVLHRLHERALPLTVEVFVGVVALLGIRFLPVLGGVVWSVCAIAALGTGIIALATNLTESESTAGIA